MPEKQFQRKQKSCSRMKGMWRLALFIIALTTMSGFALAHTPAGVDVTYNERSGELGVAITHQVEDPSMHYIKQVTVRQGTTVLIEKSYTSQPAKSDFTYLYALPQLKGSAGEIKVDVECNVFGSRSGTLSLGGTTMVRTPGAPTPSPTKAPGCVFISLFAVGLAAIRIMR